MTKVTNIETANLVFATYIKENEKLNVAKIYTETLQSSVIQRQNLRHFLTLGKLISEGLNEFNSPEAKQVRKNLGLKISVEYFIENAYQYTKKQAYNLKNCYELPNDIKDAYLNSGILESELSMRGLLKFANPKAETSEAETEAETSEADTSEADTSEASEQTKFGGVTLTLTKASKKDIEEAIAYLTKLVS
jgi:hypothetical protein